MSSNFEFSFKGKMTVDGLNMDVLIFKRVLESVPVERPTIIPELHSICLSFRINTPNSGRIESRQNGLAKITLMRDGDPEWLLEFQGKGVDELSDTQIEEHAQNAFHAWSKLSSNGALKKSEMLKNKFIGEREIHTSNGYSPSLMDEKDSETINSRPSWLQASTELMSKMWPSLSGVNTDEEKLQAYYIDQARNFGIEPPSKIKKQIREELRKAKNAHKKRKGKKHHLALAILSRWHLLAKLTVPKMREKLNREGVGCSEKAIENTLSRLNLDRPINRGRPPTDM